MLASPQASMANQKALIWEIPNRFSPTLSPFSRRWMRSRRGPINPWKSMNPEPSETDWLTISPEAGTCKQVGRELDVRYATKSRGTQRRQPWSRSERAAWQKRFEEQFDRTPILGLRRRLAANGDVLVKKALSQFFHLCWLPLGVAQRRRIAKALHATIVGEAEI
jgi:hypothetical protein